MTRRSPAPTIARLAVVAVLLAAGWWLRSVPWAPGLWVIAGVALLQPAVARLAAGRRQIAMAPIAFQGSPGEHRVVLASPVRAQTLTVVSKSMDITVYDAFQLAKKPPAVLVTGVSEERAGELVERLGRTGATAVVEKEGDPIGRSVDERRVDELP
jgi:hypothetical protein